MPFDAMRNSDDPGIDCTGIPPFHPDRLGLGMLDIQLRQRRVRPERVMRLVHIAFWLLLGFSISGTIWVQQ